MTSTIPTLSSNVFCNTSVSFLENHLIIQISLPFSHPSNSYLHVLDMQILLTVDGNHHAVVGLENRVSRGGHACTEVVMHADCMHMGKNGKELVGNEWWW